MFLVLSQMFFLPYLLPKADAASDVFRVTTYELQTGEYTGTTYTLTLNNDLSPDYYTMISGPSAATATRAADEDQVRVSGDPHSNFGTTTNSNEIQLTRGNAANNWIGALTVVECLNNCSVSGFALTEVLETSLPAGSANALQTVTDTLSSNYTANTVPFAGRFGGGISTGSTDANNYATTVGVKVSKQNSNEIRFDRYGAESRAPAAATIVTYVVTWGSEWSIQETNVTGTASGTGVDIVSEYDTASISSVNRSETWVWGAGFTRDDGLGDGALGQVITLGDGVTQNSTETLVAIGAEAGMIAPGRDFRVYVMSHPQIYVEHIFRPRGDIGATSGFQELDIAITGAQNTETYNNASTTVQYTEGYRAALFYNTSTGTGQAYSRTGAWGLRIDANTNLNYWRAYSGQEVTGWMQMFDFGNLIFSNVDTQQQIYRWRDDSTDVNSDGGWLAAENTNPATRAKNQSTRLRLRIANHGTTPEDAARQYELQFAPRTAANDCSFAIGWTGVADNSLDAFELFNSANISPDGELLTTGILSNPDGYSFVTGEARELADTTGPLGPLSAGAYTEIEYALRATDNAVTGLTYCFRVFDSANATPLESYVVYPELTIQSTTTSGAGLGEAGTFSSAVDGGWTTVNFAGTYVSPVVVGTTNSHNGQSALVFEVRNVTSTSAEMRVCESEGAASNGCDTHASETVGYLVIDAAVAAAVDGIEAGTFTASGEADTNSVAVPYTESFSAVPLVFANVNTVNSAEFPIEVVIPSTALSGFTAGICDHLQGNNDSCDPAHGNETVGWVAIEQGNEPFQELFDNGVVSVTASTWTNVGFAFTFPSNPVVIVASQTDNGGQDVEIDEARNVTTTGADVRYCEIDTGDTCDSHNADNVAWFAIEPGQLDNDIFLDQDGFRFYENINSATPTVALGAENTNIANVDNGDILQLRVAVQAGPIDINASSLSTKLQFAEATDCSVASTWVDVGAPGSGSIWRGFDNITPTDDSVLPNSLLDSGINQLQSYEEQNNSALNPNFVASGNRGEWAWVIENNGATNFTSYCFRMVTDSGNVINYSRYPQLTTSSGVTNLIPNDPTNLSQEKLSTTPIGIGETINETEIVFSADATDQNETDIVELCVEIAEIGQAFTNTETACGTPETYIATTYPCAPTGNAFYEKYDGIAGTAIADLYADPDFPNNPSSTQTITGGLLESPVNIDDNFGGRLSALICPPQDGDYVFWITGDDGSELRLSSDTNPANVTAIASVPGWTNVNEWTKYTEQQSSPITLSADQYYYIEANYKEQGGGDHVQIGWTLPDATLERPITGSDYSLPTETSAVTTVPGTIPKVSVNVSDLENGKSYHWQVRVRDAAGLYSNWVTYGGNSESESDFSIDTVAPNANIFDGTVQGVDIEFNEGELDTLSANWEQIDGKSPDQIIGLRLWLDGSDVNGTGLDPADGTPITTWVDKSPSGNNIAGTGAAVFSATEQAVAFSDDALPFDDTFDRSGGNANSHAIFSVVQGNASAATNHVWYETTTPRVSPAENGFLGGGTTLSNNNFWSSHITDKKMLTAIYDSGGTSTAWLDRYQEFQFTETQNFANSQRLTIGDDTTGGNRLETGEFVHEIIIYNQDISLSDRQELWEHMECKWQLKDCSVTYEYAIGTSPGGVDTLSWTSIGSSTSVTANSLNLQTSSVYYFSIRITDSAGNQTIVSSDGQQVAPSITFSASPTNVSFNDLNSGNSYTDTQTTILTTSTNARSGYVVRAFLTGNLSSGSATIPAFSGGTYAAPAEWLNGDTGYGFTTNDTLVQGINRFNSGTCLGGGLAPCYAPFSLAEPGDVIVDNPGPVVGAPITDENFIVTHRVTTDALQNPGTYVSEVNYVVNAIY